jgi:predicted ATP-dependent Lon-type protease
MAEKEAEVKEVLRLKGNYEAIQKREVRLQSQTDLLRREVEDLRVRSCPPSSF